MTKQELFNELHDRERKINFDSHTGLVKFLADTTVELMPNIDNIRLSTLLQDFYYDVIGISNNNIWKLIDSYTDDLVENGVIKEL